MGIYARRVFTHKDIRLTPGNITTVMDNSGTSEPITGQVKKFTANLLKTDPASFQPGNTS
jgi:hypothetical protein